MKPVAAFANSLLKSTRLQPPFYAAVSKTGLGHCFLWTPGKVNHHEPLPVSLVVRKALPWFTHLSSNFCPLLYARHNTRHFWAWWDLANLLPSSCSSSYNLGAELVALRKLGCLTCVTTGPVTDQTLLILPPSWMCAEYYLLWCPCSLGWIQVYAMSSNTIVCASGHPLPALLHSLFVGPAWTFQ